MHQLLLVNDGGQFYISDVGVGALAPCKPVPLIAGHQHREGKELYKIDYDEANGWMLLEQAKHSWRLLYSFHDNANDAKFAPRLSKQINKIAMIRTTRGRHTMMNNEFRIYEGQSLTTYTTNTEKEWLQALQRFSYLITTIKESKSIGGLLSFSDYFIVRLSNSNTTMSLCSSLTNPMSSTK